MCHAVAVAEHAALQLCAPRAAAQWTLQLCVPGLRSGHCNSLATPSTQKAKSWRGKVLSLSLTNPGILWLSIVAVADTQTKASSNASRGASTTPWWSGSPSSFCSHRVLCGEKPRGENQGTRPPKCTTNCCSVTLPPPNPATPQQLHTRTHTEEGASGIQEVQVEEGDERHPQLTAAKGSKAPRQCCLAGIRDSNNIPEVFKALNATCAAANRPRTASGTWKMKKWKKELRTAHPAQRKGTCRIAPSGQHHLGGQV